MGNKIKVAPHVRQKDGQYTQMTYDSSGEQVELKNGNNLEEELETINKINISKTEPIGAKTGSIWGQILDETPDINSVLVTSAVHVGEDEPTDPNTVIWLET